MAKESICGTLRSGKDLSCAGGVTTRYYQQAVIMNFTDFAEKKINVESLGLACSHNVEFKLKEGKEGFRFSLSENGTAISGTFEKSVNDFGHTSFSHIVNIAVAGVDEETKCILDALSKGRFVVALQFGDIVEIYGIQNGLTAGDFTADPQANSGFISLTLESLENSPEGYLPLVYKAEVEGQEIEDFDANFKQGA